MALRALQAGLRMLLKRRDVDQEVDDEIAHYIEQLTRENIRAGMGPAEAERMARARLGSVSAVHQEALSSRWESGIETTLGDVAHGARGLVQKPGFTAAAILTIALGIGANTAMFSVVNAVMFRPLPWKDANKLAMIWTDDVARGLPREATAYRTILDWRSSNRTFTDIAYYSTQRVALMSNQPGVGRGRSRSALVSANLLSLLGVSPAMGRSLTTTDERDVAPVAVISHSLWRNWFGGDSGVLGRTVSIDDASKGGIKTFTVVGVMPAGFYFPDRITEIWTPATTYWRFARESTERFPSWARRWTAIGRLAPSSSIQDGRSDLARVGAYLASIHTTTEQNFPGFGTTVTPVLDWITGQNLQSTLWILLSAVSVVLLVACVNVANLLLARGATRQHEFAVRRALGAGRGRLARQLVTESLLLSLAGGAIGLLVAIWTTKALAVVAAGFVPRLDEIAIDWRVLLFALSTSIAAGLAFGLAPALRLSRTDAAEALKEGVRSTSHSQLRRSRDTLVIAEFALALTLLVGAGLLLRSLQQVRAVDPGFDPTRVLAVRLEFPTEAPIDVTRMDERQVGPARAHARVAVGNRITERLRALPGVAEIGYSDDLFVAGQGNESIYIPGRSAQEMGTGELYGGAVSPGFFGTLRARITRGRPLTEADADQKIRAMFNLPPTDLPLSEKRRLATSEPVVVNETFVRRYFPNEDPIGKWFCMDPTGKTYWFEIVGVMADLHRSGLERQVIPEFVGPWTPTSNGRVDLLVRTAGDPLAMAASVRREVIAAVPGISVVSVSTADALLGGFGALRRLQTILLTIFALLALMLAGIGIFGVVHYTVAERTREIGVRVALGASAASVMALILRQGMRSAIVGIAVGLAASLALTRVISNLLFGVESTDVITFSTVAVLLASVALGACWLAGRRALRIDPVTALRNA